MGIYFRIRCCLSWEPKKKFMSPPPFCPSDYRDMIYVQAFSHWLHTLDSVYHGALHFITGLGALTHQGLLYTHVGYGPPYPPAAFIIGIISFTKPSWVYFPPTSCPLPWYILLCFDICGFMVGNCLCAATILGQVSLDIRLLISIRSTWWNKGIIIKKTMNSFSII